MTEYKTIKAQREPNGVLHLMLFRPQVKNAFNPELIREPRQAFLDAEADMTLRVIALRGEGGTFCSGGDLNWMKESLSYTPEENYRDAENLYALFDAIDRCRLPIVGGAEGFALGGGVGLVSVRDYVVAQSGTQFSLSEVRVGLVPACIGPFVLRKIGESQARALFLSSERFTVERALQIGLIHGVAADSEGVTRSLTRISKEEQGPLAVRTLAEIRVTPEAQEGLRAYLEKRPPKWRSA